MCEIQPPLVCNLRSPPTFDAAVATTYHLRAGSRRYRGAPAERARDRAQDLRTPIRRVRGEAGRWFKNRVSNSSLVVQGISAQLHGCEGRRLTFSRKRPSCAKSPRKVGNELDTSAAPATSMCREAPNRPGAKFSAGCQISVSVTQGRQAARSPKKPTTFKHVQACSQVAPGVLDHIKRGALGRPVLSHWIFKGQRSGIAGSPSSVTPTNTSEPLVNSMSVANSRRSASSASPSSAPDCKRGPIAAAIAS